MITEDYVSFETAKLLKENGFNEECRSAYTNYGKLFTTQIQQYITNVLCSKGTLWDCTTPTLQMAMKWLRKVYNFHIWIEPNHDKEGLYNAHVKVGWWSNNWGGVGYNTYEQACEAAIKYCLEHLI